MKLIRSFALFTCVAALTLGLVSVASGQELPPGPTTIHALSRLHVESTPSGIDETQVLTLDFAPGAWTPLHSHGGLTLVRVLEGEMTRRMHGVDDTFRAGEGWVETPGDIHSAGNAGDVPARVLVTFLLPTGAPLTRVEGVPSDAAPPGPTTAFQSRRTSLVAATGEFDEAATTVLGFAPGAWTPLHSHGGLTLVAVLEGNMSVRSGDRETVYRPGDVWIEQPGDVHAAGNSTATAAQVAVTFLLRHGAPVTTVAATQAPAPVQLPRALPRTGDASRPVAPAAFPATFLAAALLGGGLLGGGLYLRRRIAVS